ncbi:16_t:CDS:2 [Paraglomus brasilianum]|uniref:16_t:CDS:1 n=1 Tax=Paraglomus brasilianum TaxID=144538 RepID=A0A9N9BDS7_9GLOM|nr:16_t:CDS:2 [Paraglomus brasilianum]
MPFYGVSFNPFRQRNVINVFAVAGGRMVIVATFEEVEEIDPALDKPKRGRLRVLQTYTDENVSENFYCVAWSYDPLTGAPWVAVAGASGLIKIIDTSQKKVVRVLAGHGDEVNEMRFHHLRPELLFSTSKDFSIRLWNASTGDLLVVFGGDGGHRESVLGIDLHLSGNYLASCGMDHAVKIWTLCSPMLKRVIDTAAPLSGTQNSKRTSSTLTATSTSSTSYATQEHSCQCTVPVTTTQNHTCRQPVYVHYPIFSSTELHNNYVDNIRWYGDLLFSRSTEPNIILWKPEAGLPTEEDYKNKDADDPFQSKYALVGGRAHPNAQTSDFNIICEFSFEECDIWFVRFGLSRDNRFLATGSQYGKLFLWDLDYIPHFIDKYISTKKACSVNKKESKAKKKQNLYLSQKPASVTRKKNTSTKSIPQSTGNRSGTKQNANKQAGKRRKCVLRLLEGPKCTATVRQVTFSPDGEWLIAACDDGTIWCWLSEEDEETDWDDSDMDVDTVD